METQYTPNADKVLKGAVNEAKSMGHEYICTEHLLLGMSWAKKDPFFRFLPLDWQQINSEILNLIRKGPDEVNAINLPYTARSKNVIGFAATSATNLQQDAVGIENLTYGLLREYEAVASQVLQHLGTTLDDVTQGITLYHHSPAYAAREWMLPDDRKTLDLLLDNAGLTIDTEDTAGFLVNNEEMIGVSECTITDGKPFFEIEYVVGNYEQNNGAAEFAKLCTDVKLSFEEKDKQRAIEELEKQIAKRSDLIDLMTN